MSDSKNRSTAKAIAADLGEWWKPSSGYTVEGAALMMLDRGIEEGDVREILGDVIGAMREEYGE